jgi:hypothetical protein
MVDGTDEIYLLVFGVGADLFGEIVDCFGV